MSSRLFLIYLICGAGAICAAGPPGIPLVPKLFHWRPFLAPFHAVVLHLPIGFLTVAFLQEIYQLFRPSPEVRRLTGWMLLATLLSGSLAATFGMMRADTGGYETHALHLHRNYGFLVLGCTLATYFAHVWAARGRSLRFAAICYKGLLFFTLGLLTVAGHYGGNLTHGSRYLVENAPAFVRKLLDEDGSAESSPAPPSNEQEKFYQEQVKPIFAGHCYACHGPEKQKGGYRLDLPERAVQAGESGKIPIKARDPLESHLVRLILLPPDHDDVMPPDGKKPLATEEIGKVIQWIRDGAVFGSVPTNKPPVAP